MPHYKAIYRKLKKREIIRNGDKRSCDGGNYHTISDVLPGTKVDDDLLAYFDIYRKNGVKEIPAENWIEAKMIIESDRIIRNYYAR